ncbi:predicted protein [Chaetoceros tenuissimus]|uniref:Uncharacterized protein n=1 Tax=Chaetoceros tenuissimus TaxID=426638 RepID=A0AAD3CDU6_9STRA|nr:predicted protein [Chaetoceros tenuissimus]
MTTETNETTRDAKIYFSHFDGVKSTDYPLGIKSKMPAELTGIMPDTEWENFILNVQGVLKPIHSARARPAGKLPCIAIILAIVAIGVVVGVKFGQDTETDAGIKDLLLLVGGIVAGVVLCIVLCCCKMFSDAAGRAKGDKVAPKALKELMAVVEEQNDAAWNENPLVKFKLVVKDFAIESEMNFIKCTLCQEEC